MASVFIALTRDVSPRIDDGERTYISRVAIDVDLAIQQHVSYERWLNAHGCEIVRTEPLPDAADAVFVEDAAVVLDEIAVITRPGAESRRGETESVARVLQRYRTLRRIDEGTLDGGDILQVGRTLYAGRSPRTNDKGITALRSFVQPFGYTVIPVEMRDALHLKTAVTRLDDQTLIHNPQWVEASQFPGFKMVAVDAAEPFAANVLALGESLVMPDEFPRTRSIVESHGFRPEIIGVSEMLKAEAGVTCCSVIFRN